MGRVKADRVRECAVRREHVKIGIVSDARLALVAVKMHPPASVVANCEAYFGFSKKVK
jgi:hypothetical protein